MHVLLVSQVSTQKLHVSLFAEKISTQALGNMFQKCSFDMAPKERCVVLSASLGESGNL